MNAAPNDSGSNARPIPGSTGRLSNRTVSRIGYGAMQLERLHEDRSAAVSLVRRPIELGIDHLDTAHFYGNGFVNDVIREAVQPGDDVVVVSKVGADPNPGGPVPLRPAQRPEQLRASVEANLRSLGMDQIPVVNLRRLDAGPGLRAEGEQAVDIEDQLEVMTALRDEGKIGAIGISSVTLDGLRRSLDAGIVCVQNAYSLVAREDEPLLDLCVSEGIAWVPYFPLGGTLPGIPKVTDEPAVHAAAEALGVTASQMGLAWLLHHKANVLLIPGTSSIEHLQQNLAAGDIELDDATMAALEGVKSQSNNASLG